jgi:hypothetical protein
MAWLLLPHPAGRTETRATCETREARKAMLLTTLITLVFIAVSSAVLWLSIGAD